MLTSSSIEQDTLPIFCRARVLILGVGNTLFGDDGFGPAVIEHLSEQYAIPDNVCILDVGIGVRKVLFTITLSDLHPSEIVVVDAVDWGQQIGQVMAIPAEALPETKLDDFSLHQVPTSNLLRELQEQCGVKVTVIACDVGAIAQEIAPGLSETARLAVERAAQQIAAQFL